MLIEGNIYKDHRGIITFNNEFDASDVKRIYTIENSSTEFVRGWQGHKVERRWFACITGSFKISVIKIDNFENPSKDLQISTFKLTAEKLTYICVPSGCVTAIQSLENSSKLLVMSDYGIGEIDDEFRYDLDYFNKL